ncbi:MAG: hypothetical protein ACLFRB_08470 [Thiohalorhabdus sp.]|uniref:hypothetical protein n=1 Tax=Thiohalorhabdus sp. TaxID=3094134 RepID=UPI003981597E
MMLGEIRSHHPEGTPDGVHMVEIAERPLRAFRLPRGALGDAPLPELAAGGVYFLLGPRGRPGGRPRVYIGSGRDLGQRLALQEDQPPFPWEWAVAVPLAVPRVPRFHKELTKLVQLHCHRSALRARHHEVVSPEPTSPSLVPAFVERDVAASRTAIQTLLFALGHPVLGTRLQVVS